MSIPVPFSQTPPSLSNQWRDDEALRGLLASILPPDVLREIEPSLDEMGEMAAGDLARLQEQDRENEPTLTQWDAWGNRVDRIELTAVWKNAERVASEKGVVAAAYDGRFGRFARLHQFALAYLFHPSTDVYTCPLAMTDGAARTLLRSGNRDLVARALPRLTSRDPRTFWTSGQWMTESTGGSDVGLTETSARETDGSWRLFGRKWFTSAATSQMALTLARPDGNPGGGDGLALFYVETRDEEGRLRNILVNRLKEKLGTRKLPTAELTLDGTPAIPVGGLSNGVKGIVPMLHVTRTWNAVTAASFLRRGYALARDYATRRVAFGGPIAGKALHAETLEEMRREQAAALHLAFLLAELMGRDEANDATDGDRKLLRFLTSVVKATTGRMAVSGASEALEAFGGAGYVEDTGLPVLLRDSQVLPIWEGTTNVLSLDAVRAADAETRAALGALVEARRSAVRDGIAAEGARRAALEIEAAFSWREDAKARGPEALERGARRFTLSVGHALATVLVASGRPAGQDRAAGRAPGS